MTRIARGLGISVAVSLALGPIVALLAGSVVDVGPSGSARTTLAHWGVTLSDPFVGASLWNSLVVSILVVASGTAAGVSVACIVRGLRGWARPAALGVVALVAGCSPFYSAIGGLMLLDRLDLSALGISIEDRIVRWILLGVTQFGFASAWTAWWTVRALDRVQPEWRLAAYTGAARGRLWRAAVWPLIRPSVSRVASALFAILLIEPGGPLLLGLRRTIGYQIVGSSLITIRPDGARAAVLSIVALGLAGLAHLILMRSGGVDYLASIATSPAQGWDVSRATQRSASGRVIRRIGAAGVFGVWAVWGLLPTLVIFGSLGASAKTGNWYDPFVDRPELIAGPVGSALALGLLAATGAMLLAWPLSQMRFRRSMATALTTVPPLAVGVGLFGLSRLLKASGEWTEVLGVGPSALLDRLLDPYQTPWLLVTWGTAVVLLPWAIGSARQARRFEDAALSDLARLSGDPRAWSRTLLLARLRGRRCLASAAGLVMLAAGGLTPAIVLTPLEPFRPLGVEVLFAPVFELGGTRGVIVCGLLLQLLGSAGLLRGGRDLKTVAVARS